jgi:hypothetical protein
MRSHHLVIAATLALAAACGGTEQEPHAIPIVTATPKPATVAPTATPSVQELETEWGTFAVRQVQSADRFPEGCVVSTPGEVWFYFEGSPVLKPQEPCDMARQGHRFLIVSMEQTGGPILIGERGVSLETLSEFQEACTVVSPDGYRAAGANWGLGEGLIRVAFLVPLPASDFQLSCGGSAPVDLEE